MPMETYQRNGRIDDMDQAEKGAAPPVAEGEQEEGGIRVDGFQQIVDMLKVADPEFRQSLMKRLAAADPKLAKSLKENLSDFI